MKANNLIRGIHGHVTSYFTSSERLFQIRIVALVMSLGMLGWIISTNPFWTIKYFTNWSWIGLVIYFAVMTLLSYGHLKTDKLNSLTQKQIYWYGICLEALVATTQTVTWIVALVYWIILSKELPSKNNYLRSLNVIEHSIDLIFVLMEMFLTKSWINYSAVVFPLAVAWLYTFWTWIFVYSKIWDFPYEFFRNVLNPVYKTWWVTLLAIIAGSLVIVLIFTVAYGTFRLREYLGKKRELVVPVGAPHYGPSMIESHPDPK